MPIARLVVVATLTYEARSKPHACAERRGDDLYRGAKIVARARGRVAPQVMWRVKDPYLAPAPLRSFPPIGLQRRIWNGECGGWCAIGGRRRVKRGCFRLQQLADELVEADRLFVERIFRAIASCRPLALASSYPSSYKTCCRGDYRKNISQ